MKFVKAKVLKDVQGFLTHLENKALIYYPALKKGEIVELPAPAYRVLKNKGVVLDVELVEKLKEEKVKKIQKNNLISLSAFM